MRRAFGLRLEGKWRRREKGPVERENGEREGDDAAPWNGRLICVERLRTGEQNGWESGGGK